MGSFILANKPVSSKLRYAPKKVHARVVMPTPPTITFTTAATIANPITYEALNNTNFNNSSFSLSSAGNWIKHGPSFPDYFFVRFQNISGHDANSTNNWWHVSVQHTGSAIELRVKGIAGAVWAKVNGEYVSVTPQAVVSDGSISYYYLGFGSEGTRTVEFFGTGTFFGGVLTGPTDTLIPAVQKGPRLMVFGDSYVQGTGATRQFTGYVRQLGDYLGIDDVWSSGYGGTGLLNDGGHTTYRGRFLADVVPYGPNMLIIGNSQNDATSSAADLAAELTLLLNLCRQYLPETFVFVTSPMVFTGVGNITSLVWEQRAALKTATESLGYMWLDLIDMPVLAVNRSSLVLSASAAAAATTISTVSGNAPVQNTVYEFPDKTRCRIKSISGSNPYVSTLDSGLKTAQSSGAIAVAVGESLWTGTGTVAEPTGYGNCDKLVISAANPHPTQLGHDVIAQKLASMIAQTFLAAE